MITEQDLQEAIAECEGQKNPNASTCIKLAAFYTIKEHMYGSGSVMPSVEPYKEIGYSYGSDSWNRSEGLVEAHSGTEFSEVVNGMPQDYFLDIMDELISTLQIVQPRLYESVIRKLKESP